MREIIGKHVNNKETYGNNGEPEGSNQQGNNKEMIGKYQGNDREK